MRRFQNQMAGGVDHRSFFLGITSPKNENESGTLFGQGTDDGVGKSLPAMSLMGCGLVGAHRQRGVEQQHSLFGPACQVTVGGGRDGPGRR